jgi:hypothetical protein
MNAKEKTKKGKEDRKFIPNVAREVFLSTYHIVLFYSCLYGLHSEEELLSYAS